LNGLTSLGLPPAIAYITPPAATEMASQPLIYIWGGRWGEARKTVPRGGGSKENLYTVDVYLLWSGDSVNPTIDQQFPLFVEAVLQKLRSVAVPTFITDPTTNVQTTLLEVGEKMQVTFELPKTSADQRYLVYEALIACTCSEWFNA
jgi:hypothetical protein